MEAIPIKTISGIHCLVCQCLVYTIFQVTVFIKLLNKMPFFTSFTNTVTRYFAISRCDCTYRVLVCVTSQSNMVLLLQQIVQFIKTKTRLTVCQVEIWFYKCAYHRSRHLITCIRETGPYLDIKTVFPRYRISMLKIRRSRDRLNFNMGIPILKRHLYIETAPVFSRIDRIILMSLTESKQSLKQYANVIWLWPVRWNKHMLIIMMPVRRQ